VKLFFRKLGPQDWEWVVSIAPILKCDNTSGIIAIDVKADKPVAACVFDNWTPNSVQAHFVVENKMALKHGFLEECCDFVFNVAGRKAVYGFIMGDNDKAIKLNKHIGFTEKMRLEDAWGDGIDYVIMEMKKENCNYLQEAKAA